MVATATANLSVGPPYDLAVTATGSFDLEEVRIEADSPYLTKLSEVWSEHLLAAVAALPEP
jgi:putative proteasome-type protease